MIPKVNTKVYVLYKNDCVVQETVLVLGKHSFYTDNACLFGTIVDVRFKQRYDDFNKTWFKSLRKAKKSLIGEYYGKRNSLFICNKVHYDTWKLEVNNKCSVKKK